MRKYLSFVALAFSVAFASFSLSSCGSDDDDVVTLIVGDQIDNRHEYVDLGLPSGLKWATCNVGADNSEDYGSYFAWGESNVKSIYDWSTYKWGTGMNQLNQVLQRFYLWQGWFYRQQNHY